MVDTNMTFSLISSRDTETNIMFTIQFTVSHGPPSTVVCNIEGLTQQHTSRWNPQVLSREVIRSHYVNKSYPDMTRVTLTLTSPRQPRTYTCTVTVEGRVNINNVSYYFDPKGSGTTSVSITGNKLCVCCTQLHCSPIVLLLLLLCLLLLLLLFSVAGTPTSVTANRTGYDCVSVSWTAPSTGAPPSGYEVFYQLTGGGSIVSGGNTSNTELTLTGLLIVGNYSIFVVSYGAEGDPVLPSDRSPTTSIGMIFKKNSFRCLLFIFPADNSYDIPQLSSTPTLVPDASAIIVSWSPTNLIPLSYRISHFDSVSSCVAHQ